MRRREFITLIGGAAVTPSLLWPRAARAQRQVVDAFRQRLRELGHAEGENIAHMGDRMKLEVPQLYPSSAVIIHDGVDPFVFIEFVAHGNSCAVGRAHEIV
jgi:hypothetical protein